MKENKLCLANLNDINLKEIDYFAQSFKNSSFFHTSNYLISLFHCKDVKPVILLVQDNQNKIAGLAIGELANEYSYLPIFSKRLIFYDTPLYTSEEVLDFMLSEIARIPSGLFTQFRYFDSIPLQILAIYQKYGFIFEPHLKSYITIDNDLSVFKRFANDKRKGIRKATEKYGLIIKEFDDIYYSVNVFYDIIKKLYSRKRHAIRSKNYFYNLVKYSEGQVKIAFALYNNEPIATQLYIIHKERLTAFYTATLLEHREKHAGDLLVWYLIQLSYKNNIKVFDFGGGGKPDKIYPPREYKARFGTHFENVGRLILPKSFIYNYAMKFYNFILRK